MKTKVTSVYVLGASGFLGSQFVRYLRSRNYLVYDEKLDVTNLRFLAPYLKVVRPEVVINFAGARAEPNIDWCEDHKEETVKVNVAGAINAMTAAIEAGAYPIQIGSGCVYSGGLDRFFTEEDRPNYYGSFYSRMKIVLQEALAELPVLYARIRLPISSSSHPRNLIDKLASHKKVFSVPNSVTLVEDLWPALEKLIELRVTGILNLTNEDFIENKKILDLYREFVDPGHRYQEITLEEFESSGLAKAQRSNCLLSVEKARNLGIFMPCLNDERLIEVMKNYQSSMK